LASQSFSILTGGAGTGKTTVLATLIKALRAAGVNEKFTLLTPTGKAAVRLKRKIQEVAGAELEPRTIHSYLHGKWIDEDTFRLHRTGEPIADGTTTVVIDECSMLDTSLIATAFRAIDWSKVRRLILAGDPQQLPPISAGAPFKNLVDHATASENAALRPCALLVNCRQVQENSTALRLAEQFTPTASTVIADELLEQIRTGGRIGIDLEVGYFRDEKDLPKVLSKLMCDAVEELLRLSQCKTKFDPEQPWVAFDELHGYNENIEAMRLDAVEVLSPYRGNYFGADALNLQLQALLRGKLMNSYGTLKLGNPAGCQFVALDKVLQQNRNRRLKALDKIATLEAKGVDFYVANGELGRMMKIDKWDDERAGSVRFETNPAVSVRIDNKWARECLNLGYAMSVHRAQGSDFGGVVVVIPKEARQRLVSRELLYTALTRFTRRLYLLIQGAPGDPEALFSSLWRGSSEYLRRNTCLYAIRHVIPDLDEYRPDKRIIRTLRNELVASKSEALIANMLLQAKVPYYYERLLIAPDGTFRRPDFTIPVETPDGPAEIYWEHWGMLGDPDYDAGVERRKKWYAKHGFEAQLVETDELGGFDSTKIEKVIKDQIAA
jgi:exodeoxyribonuclease V alpha subunit